MDGNGMSPEEQALARFAPKLAEPPPLVVVGIHDFLAKDLPPREEILSPWMLSQSLNMIYAWRGVGKTHAALGIAYAIASGGEFLGWKAPKPRGVLYLDGEMAGSALQSRLAAIAHSNDKEPPEGFLNLVTPDLQPGYAPMPDLATTQGQEAVDRAIQDHMEVIIIDNLSCLVRACGSENEAESWLAVQGWALAKRAQGKSVLFIHHAGKNGGQRGTSKREDVLDAVICLRTPPDHDSSQGAKFEVHFEKSRNQHGEALKPIEATLTQDPNGSMSWVIKTVTESNFDRVVDLANEGLKQHEIAVELELNRSTVSRHWRKAEALGLITKGVGHGH